MKRETTKTTDVVKTDEVVTETPVVAEPEKAAPKKKKPMQVKTGVVACERLYVRSEATKESEPVTIITEKTIVTIVGEENDFYKVEVNGKEGYCMKAFIK